MNDKNIIIAAAVVILGVGAVLYATSSTPVTPSAPVVSGETGVGSGPNLALAQCLKDQGVVFYGAFWCPHCQAQKKLFGDAVPALPYVECSTPDGNSQTKVCIDNKIESYPTWVFPDGSRLTGEQSFETLATKANCTQALPGAASGASTTPPAPAVIPS